MVGPSRRDIGHGHLVERSLLPVVPDEDEFPYTIRLVAEVLSSNGSTSMGSVCGGTLAMMDAGVPIRAPVSGVAMGLVTRDDGTYRILTDIQGVEDFLGDMDFKVAGTRTGITGLQMDIKVRGITPQIMREALAQAHEGRMFILGKMPAVIDQTRRQLSPYAPRITKLTINPDRIRDIIGPGGKTIRRITEETKCTIDIEDDGTVLIGSTDAENAQKAIDIIHGSDARCRGRRGLHGQGDAHHGLRRVRRDPARARKGWSTSPSSPTTACRRSRTSSRSATR